MDGEAHRDFWGVGRFIGHVVEEKGKRTERGNAARGNT